METKVNQKLFEGQSIYAGIDCHKKNWKVTILGEQYEHKTMSQDPNPAILASYLKRNFPGASYEAVYEAGFNGFATCRSLRELNIKCYVAHPADIPTAQKEKLLKSDPVDSRKLARALRNKEFKSIHIPDQLLEADRALVRQRFRIMKDVTRMKNRVRSLLFQFNINVPERFSSAQQRHWSRVYTNWLKELPTDIENLRQVLDNYINVAENLRKDLLVLNKQVRDLSRTERYLENYKLLITCPGVGLMTAITFLVQIGDIRRFDCLDGLCAYIGFIPTMHGSGPKMQTGKMVKRGRKELKIMLIEAAWEAVRLDPVMMAKFNELTKRMNKNKAIIPIARKMIRRMRSMLLNKKAYQLGIE